MCTRGRQLPRSAASERVTRNYRYLWTSRALPRSCHRVCFQSHRYGVGSQPAYDEPQKERVCVHHVPFALCFASHSLNYGTGHV